MSSVLVVFGQQTERYCTKKKVIQIPRFILIDKVASRSSVTGKQGFFYFDGIILFAWGVFYEAFQNRLLCLFNTF